MKRLISLLILLISLNSFATSVKFTNSSAYDVSVSIDGYERLCLSGMQITELVFSGNRRISVYDPYTGGLIGTTVVYVRSGESIRVYFHEDGFRFSSGYSSHPVTFIAHPVIYVPVALPSAHCYYHHSPRHHSSVYYHTSRISYTAAQHSRPKPAAAPARHPAKPAVHHTPAKPNEKHAGVHSEPRQYQPRTTVSTRTDQTRTVKPSSSSSNQVRTPSSKPKSSSVSAPTTRPSSSTRVQSSRSTTNTRR